MLSPKGFARVWYTNFLVQVVLLVMLVKPADISPHVCASTYFGTDLLTSLGISGVQSLVEHQAHQIVSTEILDSAATKFQVKPKESMYIKWEKPDLNQQVKHKPDTFTDVESLHVIYLNFSVRNIVNAM